MLYSSGFSDFFSEFTRFLKRNKSTDDDGLLDGEEDANHDGILNSGETDPCNIDSDNDSIQDGTELGLTLADIFADTNTSIFQPDLDPSTTSNPLNDDTDGDGYWDGEEDSNHNGRVDAGETDPAIIDIERERPVITPILYLLLH